MPVDCSLTLACFVNEDHLRCSEVCIGIFVSTPPDSLSCTSAAALTKELEWISQRRGCYRGVQTWRIFRTSCVKCNPILDFAEIHLRCPPSSSVYKSCVISALSMQGSALHWIRRGYDRSIEAIVLSPPCNTSLGDVKQLEDDVFRYHIHAR